ncbi:Tetraspanin-8 [Forsythia ovata]|uniref:Tetraspanin-8 n=1 Tax=Forsythia ovata TaxID=205694 RepID=A0ABD1UD54_9LAMI
MLATAVIGLLGLCFQSKAIESIYLWVLLISTILVIIFTAFVFAVLPKDTANGTWQKSQNGYWLNQFSPSLQKALVNSRDWFIIESCLFDLHICNLQLQHQSNYHRYLQLGCCRPPNRCGLVQNGTYWVVPKSGLASQDEECVNWRDAWNGECFDCDSCKAGYLAEYQQHWQTEKVLHMATVVFLVIASVFACLAFRDDHETRDAYKMSYPNYRQASTVHPRYLSSV